MSMSGTDVVVAPVTVNKENRSYVQWGPIIGGAVIATAISTIMTVFGSAIGLSMISPWRESHSGTMTTLVIAVWTVAVQLLAFALGGYVAARMRRPWHDTSREEIEFRDGTHGLLVWATGVVIVAVIAAMTAAGAARSVAGAAGSLAGSAGVQSLAQDAADGLLRPGPNAQPNATDPNQTRAEVTRVLASSAARGEITAADRTYLAQVVAARTGISQQEAETRVSSAITSAKDAADKARKIGIVAAFLTAASLMAGAAVAWAAARTGGEHRDARTIWRGLGRGTEARIAR